MAMTWEQKNLYASYISEGNSYMRAGANCENNKYFGEAKNKYYRAMEQFEKAYELAKNCDDCSQKEAYLFYMNAKANFSDIAYREGAYINSKNRDTGRW